MPAELGGFWSESIPSDHPIFSQMLLEVPAMMDIPLVMYPVGAQSSNPADLDWPIATSLAISYDDGFAPPQWQSPGSCIVARRDKKPLSEEHLEGIQMYMEKLMECFGEDGPEVAHEQMTRDDVEEWFDDYRENEAENGWENWGEVPSIYDV